MLVSSVEPPQFRLSLPWHGHVSTDYRDDDDSLFDGQAVVNSCQENGVCAAAALDKQAQSAAECCRAVAAAFRASLAQYLCLSPFPQSNQGYTPANTESVSASSVAHTGDCYVVKREHIKQQFEWPNLHQCSA